MREWYAQNAERQREIVRASKKRNAERVREYNRRYWKANRHKYLPRIRARQAVNRALTRGDLERGPCERQGPDCRGRIEAHHDDYERPLDVRWLCAKHHGEEEQEV